MSDIFGLNPQNQTYLDQWARANPANVNDFLRPGVFSNFFGSIGENFMAAAADTGNFFLSLPSIVGKLDTMGPGGAEYKTTNSPADKLSKNLKQVGADTVDYWAPDAVDTGAAGNIVGSLVRLSVPLMLTAGNPLVLTGESAVNTKQQLERQGVDSGTATRAGLIQGAVTLAGFKVPIFGKGLASRLLTGGAGNILFGAGATEAQKLNLQAGGYDELAAKYNPADLEALITEGLMGVAFGGIHHAMVTTRAKDAILTAANAEHFRASSLPGETDDLGVQARGQNALAQAINQALRGDPVNVTNIITPADFALTLPQAGTVIDRRLAALDGLAQGVRNKKDLKAIGKEADDLDDLIRGEYAKRATGVKLSRDNSLSDEELAQAEAIRDQKRAELEQHRQAISAQNEAAKLRTKLGKIDNDKDLRALAENLAGVEREPAASTTNPAEQALRARLVAAPDKLFREYAALKDSHGGTVLNTDVARELSPEYLADRTRAADVHEAASDTIKALYAKKLSEPTPDGFDPLVRFTAGGTGAGKSSSLEALADDVHPEITYDTNMNTLSSAVKKIDMALDAGRNVQILYTYRDPIDALVHGALPRAERQAAEHGSGRTVPLAEHVRTHVGSLRVVRQLAERYKDNPRVEIRAINNSFGKENQRPTELAQLPDLEENTLREQSQAALEAEHQAGRISDATFAGFNQAGLGAANERQPHPSRNGGARAGLGETAAGGSGEPNTGTVAGNAAAGNPEAGAGPRESREDVSPSPRHDVAEHTSQLAAEAAIAANPDLKIALDDGTIVLASDALARADAAIQQAQQDAKGFAAAVACALRHMT